MLAIGLGISYRLQDLREKDLGLPKDKTENEIVTILKSYSKFKDSNIELDEKEQTAILDGKYKISIKNGSYMMKIEDKKTEKTYCEIADAIETFLGYKEGESVTTCEKTLAGAIDLGGISAEIYDTYKILTINSVTPANLYDASLEHKEAEMISLDEINYIVTVGDSLFTSMTTSFTEEVKDFAICGHVYNPKKDKAKFTIKLYDSNKAVVAEKSLEYTKEKNKYYSFCINHETNIDEIKFYSIEATK